MKHKREATGFSHILVLLVVAMLAGVGVVGWRVFSSKANKAIIANRLL
ncbi:hypothetical protein HY380_02025 [Candidatus Saccharibacteria bacterium]|nr:hypothetical protein [Candidatus Saccharibacteria bacterium]